MKLTIKQYMLLSTMIETYEEKELEKQILTHFNMLDKSLTESKEFLNDLIETLYDEPEEYTIRFRFKGVEYGLIPNLNEIKTGEWVDLESYQTGVDNIHRVMAILYRPITKIKGDYYEIEKYSGTEKLSQLFLELPVKYYKSIMVFFWNLNNQLSKDSNTSTQNQK